MNEAMERVRSRRTCSPPPTEVAEAKGATAARVRIERTCLLTSSSASFFSWSVIVRSAPAVFFAPARTLENAEESAFASLDLKEATAARARARIGAAGGGGAEGGEVEEEEVEGGAAESGNAPPAAAADKIDAIATRPTCLLATAAGALFGAEATRLDVRFAETAGRAAVGFVRGVGKEGSEGLAGVRWQFGETAADFRYDMLSEQALFDLTLSFVHSFSLSPSLRAPSLTCHARGQHDFSP